MSFSDDDAAVFRSALASLLPDRQVTEAFRGAPCSSEAFVAEVRMKPVWKAVLHTSAKAEAARLERATWFLRAVALALMASRDQSAWGGTSQRGRELWLSKLDRLRAQLALHVENGPTPPPFFAYELDGRTRSNADGEQAFDVLMMRLAQGMTSKEASKQRPALALLSEFATYQNWAADEVGREQLIKKPGDSSRARAAFVQMLNSLLRQTGSRSVTSCVAETAAVVLDDIGITERVVRKLTKSSGHIPGQQGVDLA